MRLTLDEREMININIRIHLPIELHTQTPDLKRRVIHTLQPFFCLLLVLLPLFLFFLLLLTIAQEIGPLYYACYNQNGVSWATLQWVTKRVRKKRKKKKGKRNKEKRDIFANLACDWHFFSRNIQWNHQFSLSTFFSFSTALT